MIGVYGANGFMGKHLVRRLAARGCSVRAVARQFDPEFLHSCPGSVEFVEADLRNLAATAASLRGVDALIQLASTSTPAMENGRAVRDIEENVLPHVAFMQAAADHGVRRYVFVSSGGTVYGPGSPVPTPEHAVTRPMCSYGLTKITIENYLRMYAVASDMEAVVLRVANAFGPEQAFRKGQGLIPAVLGRLAEGLPVHIVGDGRAVRDYVFIDDVIDAFEAALEKPLAGGGTFNVGSGQGQTVIEVVDAIEHAVGARIERVHVPSRSTDMDVSILDITAAATGLGWQPRTRFADGLLRTVCWWRDMIKVRDRRAA